MSSSKETGRNTNFYDLYSYSNDGTPPQYVKNYSEDLLPQHRFPMIRAVLRRIKDLYEETSGQLEGHTINILDFGCGTGRQASAAEEIAKILEDKGHPFDKLKINVIACDISKGMLDYFKQRQIKDRKFEDISTDSLQRVKRGNLSFTFVKNNEDMSIEEIKANIIKASIVSKDGGSEWPLDSVWSIFGPVCYFLKSDGSDKSVPNGLEPDKKPSRQELVSLFQSLTKGNMVITLASGKLMKEEQKASKNKNLGYGNIEYEREDANGNKIKTCYHVYEDSKEVIDVFRESGCDDIKISAANMILEKEILVNSEQSSEEKKSKLLSGVKDEIDSEELSNNPKLDTTSNCMYTMCVATTSYKSSSFDRSSSFADKILSEKVPDLEQEYIKKYTEERKAIINTETTLAAQITLLQRFSKLSFVQSAEQSLSK